MISARTVLLSSVLTGTIALSTTGSLAQPAPGGPGCRAIPAMQSIFTSLQDALETAVDGTNAGLSNEMWATIVDRDGIVCAVTFTGEDRGAQWPGSRVISAQKANTANAFSLDVDDGAGIALSSGNLYGQVQPGGSLFGLQFSNPVDPDVAYQGPPRNFGTRNDPMVGEPIGGVNVFGGGLALYDTNQNVVGGLGVSGDTSCTDHVIAWRVRNSLALDNVPGGVAGVAPNTSDNLILDDPVTPNTFEHPDCGGGVADIIEDLTTDFPLG